MQIPNYLLTAYLGYFEEEYRGEYEEYVKAEVEAVEAYKSWSANKARALIHTHSPEERLHIYLTWEGIIGYTSQIFNIAQGFEVRGAQL